MFGAHPEKGFAVELKKITTPETAHDAKERFEKQIDSCVFGDDKFKKIVFTTGFRVQSPHHSVVLQVDYVLFVVADSIRIINILHIAFPHRDRMIYEAILYDCRVQHLKLIYDDGVELAHMPSSTIAVQSQSCEE